MSKIKLLCPLLLLIGLECRAQIGASGTAAVCTSFNAASGLVLRGSVAGNTAVVVVAIRTATSTVSSVTDDASPTPSTYSSLAGKNGTNERIEIWSTAAGGVQSGIVNGTTITLSASSKFVACVFDYSGVVALGVTNTSTSTAANPSLSLTTQDSNNWCAGGFSGQGTGAFTASTGTLRASAVTAGGAGASNVGGALVDNTVVSPGTCTTSVTNTDTDWALASLELRTQASAAAQHQLMLVGIGQD